MNNYKFAMYAIYRFSSTAFTYGLLIIILPLEILKLVPKSEKGLYLGLLMGVALSIGFPLSILTGYLGDIIPWRKIKRRLFIYTGCAVILLCTLLLPMIKTYTHLVVFTVFLIAGVFSSESAHSALIIDNFEGQERAIAIRWLTAFKFLGILLGPVIAGITIHPAALEFFDNLFSTNYFIVHNLFGFFYVLTFIVIICTVINTLFITENESDVLAEVAEHNLRELVSIKSIKESKYYISLLSRLLVLMVTISLPGFLLYYCKDILLHQNAEVIVSASMSFSALGSLAGLKVLSILSSRLTEKDTMILSIAIILFGIIFLSLARYFDAIFLFITMFIFGCGYSSFFASSLDYSLKIIPSKKYQGFFMSLSLATTIVANILGMLFSGLLLYYFSEIGLIYGYLSIALFYMLLLLTAAYIIEFKLIK